MSCTHNRERQERRGPAAPILGVLGTCICPTTPPDIGACRGCSHKQELARLQQQLQQEQQERVQAAAQHAQQVHQLEEQLASVVAEGQELRQRLAVAEQELQQEQENAVSLTAVARQGRETWWRLGQSWGTSWQELRRRWGEGGGAGSDP